VAAGLAAQKSWLESALQRDSYQPYLQAGSEIHPEVGHTTLVLYLCREEMRDSGDRLLRMLQILGNIFFPVILLGMLAVELTDWMLFNTAKMHEEKDALKVIKGCLYGWLFWIIVAIIVGIFLLCRI
jgi:hypothetical protein